MITWHERSRLKNIRSAISDLCVKPGDSQPISLSKKMLSNAKFIAQLDSKYIVIKCGSLLCAVDQYAADKRIGLERLEAALLANLTGDNFSTSNVSRLVKNGYPS